MGYKAGETLGNSRHEKEIVMKAEFKRHYEEFGFNMAYFRKKKKLTQQNLADQVDVDRSHISAIEVGNVGVSFDLLFRICQVLEITPKQLFDFRE